MAFIIKEPPVFTMAVEQWNRETLADGVELAKVPEALLNNDVYLKGEIERQECVKLVTLTAAGWTGNTAPYVQTVNVAGAVDAVEPTVVSGLAEGASAAEQKAYQKAFGIVCGGTATLGNGTATFKVYKKPVVNLTIGLKGVK